MPAKKIDSSLLHNFAVIYLYIYMYISTHTVSAEFHTNAIIYSTFIQMETQYLKKLCVNYLVRIVHIVLIQCIIISRIANMKAIKFSTQFKMSKLTCTMYVLQPNEQHLLILVGSSLAKSHGTCAPFSSQPIIAYCTKHTKH